MEWLENLKVGDKMFVMVGDVTRVVNVTKVTSTQVHTKLWKFRKKDGGLVGGQNDRHFGYILIERFDDEKYAKLVEAKKKKDLIKHFKEYDYSPFMLKDLLEIESIIKTMGEKYNAEA